MLTEEEEEEVATLLVLVVPLVEADWLGPVQLGALSVLVDLLTLKHNING